MFNGRTEDSESSNHGSNPCLGTITTCSYRPEQGVTSKKPEVARPRVFALLPLTTPSRKGGESGSRTRSVNLQSDL